MIHVLDQKTIDKIAAGEVIERPASVVKELVENSIDAGASRVTVEVRDGGTTMIRVTDNGGGIPAEEIKKAFLRHATSKLESAEDLVGIGTLGFRGEALSTISAVTQTEMITKTPEALTGIKYVIHGGTEVECKEIGAPDGTTILCRNIFYNTPARLKFLKTNMTEGSYISDLVSHIALSHPEVSITLISNGKTIVDTSGNGKLKDTIYTLYGRDITSALLPVDYESDGIRVTGFVGKPFLARGNRSFENYFVNGRFIKSQIVNRAIEEAYKTYIMQHRFPFTVLFLELPKEECDVNVHPTKREFKYQREKELFSSVFHAVQDALSEKTLIPDVAADYGTREKNYRGNPELLRDNVPYGKQPAQPPRTPMAGPAGKAMNGPTVFPPTGSIETPAAGPASKPVTGPAVTPVAGHSENSVAGSAAAMQPSPEPAAGMSQTPSASSASVVREPSGYTKASTSAGYGSSSRPSKKGSDSYSILEALMPKEFRDKLKEREAADFAAENAGEEERKAAEQRKQEKYEQASLTDTEYLSEQAAPDIRVIGQIFNTYWITQYRDNLYYMDQHAAHEKVNYERFLAEFKTRTIHSQQIYPPKIITLSGSDKQAVMQAQELFEKAGFELSDFGGNEVKLSALPANLLGLSGEDVFLEFAAYLASGISGVTEDIFVHKLATMGCKSAIKGNQRITVPEVEQLLRELLTLENPYTCPHGRPTIIRISKEEMDKRFRRIVE
ncbi:MAG: DNA mismatch repair endonuclease MutL [Eubacterium sp.]|nr:DNA mismatch repair endonuclease MutL [Eubacterium sp.]